MAAETSSVGKEPSSKTNVDGDIVARRNQPLRRIWRFVRVTWIWFLVLTIIIAALSDREVLNAVLLIGQTVGQLLLLLSFAILQFVAIFWFMARSKTEVIKPGDPKSVTFDDYQGQPQLLALVRQWISLLSDRTKFQKMGGRFVSGILLYGPPGTGKTLLAKVMAGEAGVSFISIEGSGFRAMFWGVDVLKMIAFIRKARKLAREYGACIAFIDEIDAVGASRGGVMGGQTTMGMGRGGFGGMGGGGTGALTRLLYEMDGVEEKTRFEKLQAWYYKLILKQPPPPRDWHVLFMGSTNRPDTLDPALTRPGRFDRMIGVDPPDRTGRRAITQYYLSKIKHDDTVDVEAIVGDTSGYTPAQIMAAITKDAVRMAIFDNRDLVSQRDIDLAFQEQAMGLENPIEEMEEDQREQVAYHEAGHAVAVHYLMPEQRIVRATIIRRSGALGYVLPAAKFEVYSAPLTRWVRSIMVSLAGDISTRIKYYEPWSGTGSDYQHVRNSLMALAMQGYFGPPVGDPTIIFKDKMENFWKDAEAKTDRLLRQHWAEVDAIAQILIEKGDLSGKEVVSIINRFASSNGQHPEEAKQAVLDVVAEKADGQSPSSKEAEPVPAGDGVREPPSAD
ncbi:MAG TPA: AAA family ATPase [Anaerolineales bacterium]|nr:AAA family ATPase [Anaerolineales bacterium]